MSAGIVATPDASVVAVTGATAHAGPPTDTVVPADTGLPFCSSAHAHRIARGIKRRVRDGRADERIFRLLGERRRAHRGRRECGGIRPRRERERLAGRSRRTRPRVSKPVNRRRRRALVAAGNSHLQCDGDGPFHRQLPIETTREYPAPFKPGGVG